MTPDPVAEKEPPMNKQIAELMVRFEKADATGMDMTQKATAYRYIAKDALSLLSSQQWVPCSERLPKKYGSYEVTMQNYITKKLFVGIDSFGGGSGYSTNIIAWRELPAPYTSAGEGV